MPDGIGDCKEGNVIEKRMTMTMTVQDLFQIQNKEDILDAYMFDYGYNHNRVEARKRSILENIQRTRNERTNVSKFIDYMRTCKPVQPKQKYVLMAIPETSMFYEDKGHADMVNTFYVDADEAFQKMSSSDWDDAHINVIAHYAYEMLPAEEAAGFEVAEVSLRYLHPLAIIADIINELTFFGYDQCARMERVKELKMELTEAVEEIKTNSEKGAPTGRLYEEYAEEHHKQALEACESEDERAYMILEEEFDQKTREIRDRYTEIILEINRKQMVHFYKEEFMRKKQ